MATATLPRKLGDSARFGIPPAWPMRRFTVDEYERMIQQDILGDDDKVELLEGWITAKQVNENDDPRIWDNSDFDIPPRTAMRRWTVDEYHRLIKSGILGTEDRLELIHGWLVRKMTVNPPHAYTVRKLQKLFQRMFNDDWVVSTQNPVTTDDSEPEPDILIAPGPDELHADRHPGPDEAYLIVEVADSSLAIDRTKKLQLYAHSAVPAYWIVNLIDGIVEVHTQPRKGSYRKRADYTAEDSVPVVLSKKTVGSIPVKEFLP
jgi:hypothetical protein